MSTTAYWAPNQAAVNQVETYTFSAPNGIGSTFNAAINGKNLMYSSVSGDTAATCCTALFNLLNASTGIAAELNEIVFADTGTGGLTATSKVAGTPFANVPGTTAGLVLSTGNGLANGITTVHTTPNASPSDVNDAQNWLRFNLAATPPVGVRQLPQNGDDVDVRNSKVPMLWNLGQLAAVLFNTYTRWRSMTGAIGLPENNPGGYVEWRATYFKFSGPAGSVPAGGLQMVLGQGQTGSGPTRERYDAGSSQVTLTILAAGNAQDAFGVRFLGQHTANTFTVLGGASLGIAMLAGEVSRLSSCTVDGGATIGIGAGVVWTAASTLTMNGGSADPLMSAPATLALNTGAQVTITTDGLTWVAITARGSCSITMLAGGIITTLTLETGSSLDKSQDLRALTITNSTIDGDTCQINDTNNAITFTNASNVKQRVNSGPFLFTGTRTVKVV